MPTHLTPESILGRCDHAILHPTMTDAQMRAELEAVRSLPLATVCIKPYAIRLAAQVLAGTRIGVGTVIGFPHGSATPQAKHAESLLAIADGATELDMVINVGKSLSHDWTYITSDVQAVVDAAKTKPGTLVKVIFETDYLTDEAAKIKLCQICTEVGANYVKTSTGFGFAKQPSGHFESRGAQDSDLILMRKYAGPKVGVKASGGIRTLEDAERVIALGVTRIGTSSSIAIYKAAAQKYANRTVLAQESKAPDTGY